jgi:2,4-dienoyl-CoA reductase (NADPH2)
MAVEAGWSKRRLLMEELRCRGVTLLTEVEYKGIESTGVRIIKNGQESLLPADTVVIATGVKPNRELAEQLKQLRGKIQNIVVGDCKEPRNIIDAIEEGRMAALQVD